MYKYKYFKLQIADIDSCADKERNNEKVKIDEVVNNVETNISKEDKGTIKMQGNFGMEMLANSNDVNENTDVSAEHVLQPSNPPVIKKIVCITNFGLFLLIFQNQMFFTK